MLVQASCTEEGHVVFRLYRTGAEAANGMRGTRHLYTLKNGKCEVRILGPHIHSVQET